MLDCSAESPVQRPRAVMPGTNRDAQFVEHLPGVVRVDAVQHERHRAATVVRAQRAEDPHAGDGGDASRACAVSASSCAATFTMPSASR